MKINVGIIGYGNLGKAVESNLKDNPNFNLVKIFTKRKLNNCEHISNLIKYKEKINLLFLCCGSKDELEKISFDCIKNFSIIDCYDNHNKLKPYISKIDRLAKLNKQIALCSFGWDPGIFSLMRGMFDNIGFKPFTFWGKGISQGHTQAIKNICGVVDALQFTLPSKSAIKKIKHGKNITQNKHLHKRLCFVVCNPKNKQEIKHKIITMPDYFEGYKTIVKFVSKKKLDRLKNFSHKGLVTTQNHVLNFSLNAKSNPNITAKIMINFASAYSRLKLQKKYGAYSIFDIPFGYILQKNQYEYL